VAEATKIWKLTSNTNQMNKLDILFTQKNKNILSVYFTAGYPQIDDFEKILIGLSASGVDLVEIGVPFSDPLADGPTIQQCNLQAIANGMTLHKILSKLKDVQQQVSIPTVIMSYLNPILNYGIEAFCKDCNAAGVSGVIIPDLPPYLFKLKYEVIFTKYNIHNIFLITPQSSDERILQIDAWSNSFIYFVAEKGITGSIGQFSDAQMQYFERIQSLNLQAPILAGFGIASHAHFLKIANYFNGAIVGSAFLRYLAENKPTDASIKKFVDSLLTAGDAQ